LGDADSIASAAFEKVNGQGDYRDEQHDVDDPADRFLQKGKSQQPEHKQHAPDNQEHLVAPDEVSINLRYGDDSGAEREGRPLSSRPPFVRQFVVSVCQ
jgi:hypothetical protein